MEARERVAAASRYNERSPLGEPPNDDYADPADRAPRRS